MYVRTQSDPVAAGAEAEMKAIMLRLGPSGFLCMCEHVYQDQDPRLRKVRQSTLTDVHVAVLFFYQPSLTAQEFVMKETLCHWQWLSVALLCTF